VKYHRLQHGTDNAMSHIDSPTKKQNKKKQTNKQTNKKLHTESESKYVFQDSPSPKTTGQNYRKGK
jgi:hypothetical protein